MPRQQARADLNVRCHKVDGPVLLASLQTRVESGCSRSYLGMHATDCAQQQAQLFAKGDASARCGSL